MTDYENMPEIKTFRDYLRIASVHPDIDYGKAYFSHSFKNSLNVIKLRYIFHIFQSHV